MAPRLYSGGGEIGEREVRESQPLSDLNMVGEIKVWDLKAGKEIRTLNGHRGAVRCLALSPDGKRLYSGSLDNTIRVWDLEDKP